MSLARAQLQGNSGGETERVLPSPSCSQPGSAPPQKRRSSRPQRTPHAEVAAFPPRVHPRRNPPDCSLPSLCANARRPGASVSSAREGNAPRPLRAIGVAVERVRGGRWGGQNGACARGHPGTRNVSARASGRSVRCARRRAGGRISSSPAPLYFFADSWASGILQRSFFRGVRKPASDPR